MFYYQFLLLLLLPHVICTTINIGGIFDDNKDIENSFHYAIESIVKHHDNELISHLAVNISSQNPYEAQTSVCSLLQQEALIIFGPKDKDNIDAIQSVCDAKEIPHVLTRPVFRPLRAGTIINLHPHPPVLSKAYVDIVKALEWESFTILYEDDDSLIRVGDLIKMASEKLPVTIKQLDSTYTNNYRETMKEMRKSGQRYFVIDCKIESLENVLIQIQQLGLMTHHYHYFITNLDSHMLDWSPFQYSNCNISVITIINTDKELVKKVSTELFGEDDDLVGNKLKTEAALTIDSITLFYDILKDMEVLSEQEISCTTATSWAQGYSIVNAMKTSIHNGLTGVIQFDNEGFRSNFQLEILELVEEGLDKIGIWNSSQGVNLTRAMPVDFDEDSESLRNKTFIVITALTAPHGMFKETTEFLTGNDRFEGFGIDLIHELSLMEGFNYTFIISTEGNGARNLETGKWSGMIGDVIEHRADLAITDLTITSERESGVDFTTPFMNLGISILFRKPKKAPPSFFSFADPFAIDTWMGLAIAYSVVSVSLFIMGRLCPDEWTNPFPCVEAPDFLVNQFSFQNSIWFTIGSLMQQGTELAPIAISTRMVAGMWWFFVLIMVSSYTANLAAFLTNEKGIELFTDIYSLVENAQRFNIKYGAKKDGATAFFFRDSHVPLYKKVHEHMVAHPEDMVKENKLGVIMAEEENYAFFMESTSIEYETQRHCDLMQYGKLLDDKGYGIAMRKNSNYRKRLSTAVLKLQSSGKIATLKRKWWEERRGGGSCGGEIEAAAATPLNLRNVEGVFYVTIYGVVTAALLVIIEMVISVVKLSATAKISLREAFNVEMKAYLNFDSNVKPVINAQSESASKKSESASKKTESAKESGQSNNGHSKPDPYGFVLPSIKDRLTES